MNKYRVRLAEVTDARAASKCHIASQIATYEAIMPSTWEAERLADIPDAIERRKTMYQTMHDELAAGVANPWLHWVGLDGDEIVAVSSAGPGQQQWEIDFGFEPPPIDDQLGHLYMLSSAFGSGLAQDMLDIALPNGKGAYMWVVRNNPRAEAFYRRNGFEPDGYDVPMGERWHRRRMFRMWRPDPA